MGGSWSGQHRDHLSTALAEARVGRYDVLLVWARDQSACWSIQPVQEDSASLWANVTVMVANLPT